MRYTAGGFDVFYSYNNAAKALEVDNHSLGLSYDFGVAKIMGTYLLTDYDTNADSKQYSLGVQVPVGAGVISAGFGHEQNLGGARDVDQDTWSIAYKHNLSKRTYLYAGYQRQDLDFKHPVGESSTARDTYGVGVAHHF